MQAIIAGAGGAAHLPGMVAALTPLPVIGVPVKPAGAHLDGLDALLSIVQVPHDPLTSYAQSPSSYHRAKTPQVLLRGLLNVLIKKSHLAGRRRSCFISHSGLGAWRLVAP